MTTNIHPVDVRHGHAAQHPLVLAGLILAILLGLLASQATEAGASTAVTSITVERGGTRLGTTVVINSSRRINIVVGDTRLPDGKADYYTGGMSNRVVDNFSTTGPTPSAYRTHRNLKPAKLYFIQVYAQEPNGQWTQVVRNRAEMTKSRVVKVYYDKVEVLFDGDRDWYAGCGELSFRHQVEHRWGTNPHWTSDEYVMCDGQTYTMNWSSPFVTQNGSSLALYAAVQDDDTAWNVVCRAGWGGCGDFSEGARTLPLPNEDNDGYTKPFSFHLNGKPNIIWHGRYWVGYV